MRDITVHNISTNLATLYELCRVVVDRGDVFFDLMTDAGLMVACQRCTERPVPDLYNGVLDRLQPPLS